MKKHYIPPNYDASHFMILGFFRASAIFESGLLSVLVYYLLQKASFFFAGSFSYEIVSIAVSVLLFILFLALSATESFSVKLLKVLKYRFKKRELKYRPIKKRYQLKTKNSKTQILKRDQRYSQEFVMAQSFNDGIIKTTDNRYVKILELEAVNFASLKSEEVGAILQDFARLLKIGPEYAQLKVISKKSDLSPYINNLRKKAESENEKSLLSLHLEVIEQLSNLSESTALEHRYFYIFSTEPKSSKEDFKKIVDELWTKENLIRSLLAKRGVHIKSRTNFDEDLANVRLLYEFYNRNSSEDESYLERRERVLNDTKSIRNITAEEPLNLKNVVAPRGVDITHPDYILIDGLYYSFLTISDYPEKGVSTGWLSKFINVGEGFDFDVLIRRVDKNEIRPKLKKRNIFTKTNADQMNLYSSILPETKNIIRGTEYILNMLEGDNEFFYVTVILTLVSETLEDLYKKKKWIKSLLEGYNFKISDPKYEMEDAYNLTTPLCKYEENFMKKYQRNILTESLTAFYPYTTASISQIDGIAIGVNKENHSPVILDIFNPISNLFVFGTTGYGKSFLCMLLASRLRLMQTQVYVIAPIKAHEYKKLTECVGGSFIEIGPGSKHCINILEVRPMYRYERRDDEEEGVFTESSFLNEKIQDLLVFFELITENTISREARDLLSPFLVSFYAGFGITDDNNSIYIDRNIKKGFVKMPILSDLYNALLDSGEPVLSNLAIPLRKFTEGNLKYFDNQTNVDLDNKFCVLDMSKAIDYDDTRNLVIYIVQNFVWSRVRADRNHRKAIIYEEIWKMLANKESANTIREVFKTIRGFYGIAIGITQNLEDLTRNSFGVADGILNNTRTQLIMHGASDEASKLKNRFELSDYEYGVITGLEVGETLIITPEEHYQCRVLATKTEEKLFETDGNKLKRQRND